MIDFFLGGCPCSNFDCDLLNQKADSCLDLKSNANYQYCYEEKNEKLENCLDECKEFPCINQCHEDFRLAIDECPCAKMCQCKT